MEVDDSVGSGALNFDSESDVQVGHWRRFSSSVSQQYQL